MDDAKLEKITEQIHISKANLVRLRNGLKKFSVVEKMIKDVDFTTL